ncbi:hypothetical protein [Bacillus bombysepticus]
MKQWFWSDKEEEVNFDWLGPTSSLLYTYTEFALKTVDRGMAAKKSLQL